MEKKHLLSHAFSSYCSPPFGLGAIGCERTVKKSGAKHHSGADWLARCYQPAIKFLLYQSRLFQQADQLSPDDLIDELLSDEADAASVRSGRGSTPNAYQEELLSIDQLRERMPVLRQGQQTLRDELQATADQTNDRLHSCAWAKPSQHSLLACAVLPKPLA
jgi:hypothetical protein